MEIRSDKVYKEDLSWLAFINHGNAWLLQKKLNRCKYSASQLQLQLFLLRKVQCNYIWTYMRVLINDFQLQLQSNWSHPCHLSSRNMEPCSIYNLTPAALYARLPGRFAQVCCNCLTITMKTFMLVAGIFAEIFFLGGFCKIKTFPMKWNKSFQRWVKPAYIYDNNKWQ